jgi:iron complex outermembrane recepter protein
MSTDRLRWGIIVASAFTILLQAFIPVSADDTKDEQARSFSLNEIVVTADRYDQVVERIPAQLTVITREDIQESPSKNVVDLLSTEGGLVKRGFLGNDKKAAIDIRGMGETSVSSVLVLVDGIRINPADMAGPDLSTVTLDQIERIEILRGAGTVLYGNGAVGGVVNIITRCPEGETRVNAKVEAGSFDTFNTTLSAGGSAGSLRLTGLGNFASSDGYRENGKFDNQHVDVKAAVDLSDNSVLQGKLQVHQDAYGFPGPLTKDQFQQNPRQSMDTTGSDGKTRSDMIGVGLDTYIGDAWHFSGLFTSTERENRWVQLNTPGRIHERSYEFNFKTQWQKQLAGHSNELSLGFDYRQTDYDQTTSFASKPYQQDSYGLFLMDKVTLHDQWVVQAGSRVHRYDNEMKTSGEQTQFDATDFTAGLIYLISPTPHIKGSLFINYAESFRIPDIDELGFATEDIRPQSGVHWDAGVKLVYNNRAELSLTRFYIRIEDEIWFDPLNYINTNYDEPTSRRGAELAIRFYPYKKLRLWGLFSYTEAVFEDSKTTLPTVPNHKASAGVHWAPCAWLHGAAAYSYVGNRPQGGDPSAGTDYQNMPSYQTLDTKLTMDIAPCHLKFFVAVNNLLDASYYSLSYYDNIYPSPDRNYRIGLEWQIN